jgi:two-component system, chemotaxis family, CheB/CheR fusion protein
MSEDAAFSTPEDCDPREPVPIIGIGASAGGLHALEQFFDDCPVQAGVAFVVVQHLSPSHESYMESLLARRNRMPVRMLKATSEIEPDHIYLIPPGSIMRLSGNHLVLTPRESGMFLPIDIFFESLAEERADRAVVVILSGTGSDGTRGAEAVNSVNGFVLAQEPGDASFEGMPQSVIRSGIVDDCLPANRLARRAVYRCGRPSPQGAETADGFETNEQRPIGQRGDKSALLDLLQRDSQINFNDYKQKTVDRRIDRRMKMAGIRTLGDYLALLQNDPSEIRRLIEDILIGVTSFFRDTDAFDAMERTVVPTIVDHLQDAEDARIWVAGCSTGQEAYSLAMLFLESFSKAGKEPRFRIFATDVNQNSLDRASNGLYPIAMVSDIGPRRLERFFLPDGENYRVTPELRRNLLFVRHDMLRDPPFTRLMLASSRNTLIYLKPQAQARALNLLRFSVQKGGYVFLGRSETLQDDRSDFKVIDNTSRIFQRSGRDRGHLFVQGPQALYPVAVPRKQTKLFADPVATLPRAETRNETTISQNDVRSAERVLMDHWTPPALLVDTRRQVHQFQGDLSRFLHTRTGGASLTLDSLLPEALCAVSDFLLGEVFAAGAVRVSEPIDHATGDRTHSLRIVAIPVVTEEDLRFVWLCFEQISDRTAVKGDLVRIDAELLTRNRIEQLERMLRANRANLQDTIEQLETSNEELQSTNEELMASNEELQSTNEELQSVNEEINTVNSEYHEKLNELKRLSGELESVLRGAGLSTIFLDEAQLVKRFSSGARAYFRLRTSDIGRPLSELSHSLLYSGLQDDVIEAMHNHEVVQREVLTDKDEFLRVRIVPYDMREGQPPRTVLTLTDITAYRTLQRLQRIIDALPAHIAVLNFDGTIALTNEAWNRFAIANGDTDLVSSGVGSNYLKVCVPLPTEALAGQQAALGDAARAHDGIRSVLEGTAPNFSMRYPCHSPEKKRWFFMTVAPVEGQEFGAVVSHVDITEWWLETIDGLD